MLLCGAWSYKDDFDYPVADDGILILNNDPDVDSFKMGMDICEALQTDDTIVEFEITNNRPDCLSVLGLHRRQAQRLIFL